MGLMHVRRFWVAGIVLVAVLALLPFSFHAERHLETATRVEGSDAETVKQELSSRFHSPFVDRVVLVVEGLPPANSDEGGQALAAIEAGTERFTRRVGHCFLPRFARSGFSGQGRWNVCSDRD